MILFWLLQLLTATMVSGIIFVRIGWQQAASTGVGWGILLATVALHQILWTFLFRKKLIAPALGIIVFKYALLGFALFHILRLDWMNLSFLLIGLTGFVVTAVIGAFVHVKTQN